MRIPASTLTETLRRRLTGAALPLLAAALLLALPTVAAAQVQRVLVISYTEPATDPAPPLTVTEHEADASADPPNDVCRTTYDVKLNTEPSSAVTVTVVSGDTTVAQVNPKTLTFTISESGTEWHTAQPVTVYCVDDDVDNPGDERSVTITHTPSGGGFGTAASVQVTVYDDVDDDAEILLFDSDVQAVTTAPLLVATVDERGADQTDSYSVRLKTEPTDDVIVDVTSGDTVGATISPASLTFTPTNWSETQTVTVTGVDDSVDNPDTPGSRSVTITHTPRDGGGYGSGETKTATVTVNDEGDAPASPTEGLEYSPSQPVVLEGQQAVYTVKLRTKPTGTVTLYLSKDVSTHLKSFDPSELTFTTTNWDTPQSVTVTGFDDDVDDADQARTTTITHRPSGGGYEDAANTTLEVGLRDDDTAGLLLSRSAVPLVDAGNTVSYTVVLRSEPIGTVTVAVDDATPPGSDPDSAVQSVSPSELTFTADNWDTRQTVTITAETDQVDNGGSRSATIRHAPSSDETADPYGTDQTKTVVVTVKDDDTAEILIDNPPTMIAEGSEQTYTVSLRSNPSSNRTVTVSVPPDSAVTPNSDPTDLDFDLTFAPCTLPCAGVTNPWDQAQTVTLYAAENTVVSGTRTVTITHSAGDYAAAKEADVRVTDNDSTSGLVLSGGTPKVSDSNDSDGNPLTATYTVSLTSDADRTITMSTVGPADRVRTVTSELTFQSCRRQGTQGTGTLCSDLSMITHPWYQPQTVTVTVTPDHVDNGNQSVIIRHTAGGDFIGAEKTVTVEDDDDAEVLIKLESDSEVINEGGKVQYGVTLKSSPPSSGVTVHVFSNDPSIATVTEPANRMLLFSADDFTNTIEKSVTVSAVSDRVDDPRTRRPVYITFTPSGGGGYGPGEARQRLVTVVEDDVAKLKISPPTLTINEKDSTSTYSVSLETRPTGTVTVKVSSINPAAATVAPDTLTFRPVGDYLWNLPQQVTVTGVSDSTRGDRTATITNDPSGGGYDSAPSASVTVTVEEDETQGIRVTPDMVTVVEGATATYTVELNAAPKDDETGVAVTEVTVAIASGSPAATVSPASLTFTNSNWGSPQQVTVTGTDDEVVTGDRPATITHSSDGGAHNYNYTATVDVTVMEDDATLALSLQAVTVSETGTGTYTVKLNGKPRGNGNVTVKLDSGDPGVATVRPAALTFTPANYATAQTVTVSGVNDRVDNAGGSRSTSITHTPSGGGYDSTEPSAVSVTVTDDEGLRLSKTAVVVGEDGGTASYTLELMVAPTGSVTVELASSDTSIAMVRPAALIFTSGNWSTPQSISVTGVDDDIDNPGDARSATITHAPSGSGYRTVERVSVTVTDDDEPPTGIALTVDVPSVSEDAAATQITLTAAPTDTRFGTAQTLTVQVGASGDSATEGTDYAVVDDFTMTIGAGAADATATFTLTPENDLVFEGEESITVTATLPGVITVFGTTLALTDNDAAPMLSITGSSVAEGADDATAELVFTVAKSGAESAVATTVEYADNFSGSADSGMDYAPLPEGTLTFAADETEQTITVTVRGDATYEIDESIEIELSNPTNGALAVATAAGTIENDDPAPEFSITGGRVAEGAAGTSSVLLFTVTKNGATNEVATVDYVDARSGTATLDSDYSAITAGTLTFAAGETAQEIRVIVRGDATYELDETIEVALGNATHATIAVGIASGDIVDDDTQPVLSIIGSSVTEGAAGSATELLFTVTKSGAETEVPTTVEYVDAGSGTADSGTDYTAVTAGMLTFAAGETVQTISVMVQGDAIYEEDETVDIRLSNPAHGTFVTDIASGTIVNDDAAPVLSISGSSVAEGAAGATTELVFTVTKSGPVSEVATTVEYADAGTGTAGSDDDYAALRPGTLTFAADETVQTISVMVQGDAIYEEDETVDIVLSNATHGIIATDMASGTIANDDTAPELSIVGSSVVEGADGTTTELVFTVTKSGSISQVVTTVDFGDAGSGTATSGTDYTAVVAGTLTFAAEETTQTISVMVLGDAIYEDDETVDIMLSNAAHGTIATGTASGMIVNDEAAPALAISGTSVVEGNAGSTVELVFTVIKSGLHSEVATTVEYADAGTGTADSGIDYLEIVPGMLTFAPDESVMTISVMVQGDAVFEEDETVDIALSNATHGTIAVSTASGIITNDDAAPTLAISGSTVAEGDADTTTALLFTVTKSGPTSRVATVSYRDTGGGTATSGTDYRAVRAGTLTFAADETTQTIRVTVQGDNEYEEDETVELELRNPSNATIAAGQSKATGTITDDDPLPQVAKDWLARFGRGAANHTLDAIARRMNDAAAVGESSLTLAGRQMSLAPAPAAVHLAPGVEPWEDGVATVLTLEQLANGSGFDLERSFAEGYLNVWGAGAYSQFEMTPRGTYMMDGSLMSAIVGVDHEGANHVVGVAVAYHGGSGTFSGLGSGSAEGDLGTNLFSLHPYVRVTVDDMFHIGGSFGFGTGDLRIEQTGGEVVELGVGMPIMAAADVRVDLSLTEAWILAIQADGNIVQMATAETDDMPAVEAGSSRLRLGLENSFAFLLGEGVSLAPVLEAGVRYDAGDAETGIGFDLGGALRFDAAAAGLMVEARGQASLANLPEEDADDADEAPALRNWSVGGVIRWRPLGSGMGPQVSVAPSWSGTGIIGAAGLNAEAGYGLAVFGNGVLTPYGAVEFAGNVPGVYHVGARLVFDQALQLSAEGTHQEASGGTAEQVFTVQLRLLQ